MKWPLSKGISGRINPLVKPSSRNSLALPLMAQIRRSPVEYGESTLLYKVSCIHLRWVLFAGVLNHQQGSTWRVNFLPQLKLMRRFGAVNGGLICIHIRDLVTEWNFLSLKAGLRVDMIWRMCTCKRGGLLALLVKTKALSGLVLFPWERLSPSRMSFFNFKIVPVGFGKRPFKMVFKSWFYHCGNLRYPPKSYPPPNKNKALLTAY